ncbi:arylsulfatase [Phenylobacterium sp. Root77]|uniref:arylsulfatase n=1 Tax=unclassified Phenylobacterium TaxID=2640670 RepID=UPI0006FE825A|nr:MULTISPECIES: arylsulfatase [unclassified Phenylobacterium]KQW72106.1 arylsulfatase [Phenylobacterium sp. Root1277]KQW95026.1 arylsulfatase [Phenylobacterium sp. Root1290]KRC44719.1 arylsulfatase [Phenylobacterium sp. Root77]
MSLNEYKPGQAFPGVIGRTFDVSKPAWPAPNRAREGAPNVLFIVLDDTGFGHLGCYGSPIETPHLNALAADGLLYNSMHTTALCSPSRSCMLTGRNHHSNGMACITEGSTGYPGGNGYIPFENGMLSEILQQHGYNTYALGKWHLTPAEASSAAGPYDRWPLGRGFERYYGFLGGDTHQYYPELVRDNSQTEPEKTPEEGYHLTPDLVEKAKAMIADAKQVAPNKPFFMYFCTGAMHAPHHVPKEWADKYKGQFDDGWDAYREKVFANQKKSGIIPPDTQLSRHDPDVQDWSKLPADERRLYARMMEVFAGFLEHTDHYIGELIAFLKELGEYENTLIMVISDNGASAEGGPHGSVNEGKFFNNVADDLQQNLAAIDDLGGPKYFNHYPWGWTHAGNTPFRRWKRETYRGGTCDPFLITWPKGIKARGEIRSQYCHAIDMVPTVLDALGIEAPTAIRGVTQSPLEGFSLKSSFDDAKAGGLHITQYFEMFGHRSLYHDGWRAVCPWPGTSFAESGLQFGAPIDYDKLIELDAHGWELYNIDKDFAETDNLADKERERLIAMIGMWYVEAGKYDVLPIDSRGTLRFADERPQIAVDRKKYVYYPGTQVVSLNAAPRLVNVAHAVSADVTVPAEGGDGVLLSMGGNDGGYVFYVERGKLTYGYNYVADQRFKIQSDTDVPAGEHVLSFEFTPTGKPDIANGKGVPADIKLFVDGKQVGSGKLPVTIPLSLGLSAGVCVGADAGAPVMEDYTPPYRFNGRVKKVLIDISGEPFEDKEAQVQAYLAQAMARQ